MPEQVLTIIQYGKESTHGTAVPADIRLVGTVTLPASDRDIVIPRAGIGKRIPGLVAHIYEERTRERPMRRITPDNWEYDGPEEKKLD